LPNHPITPLASSKINHDTISIELLEPDAMPAMVRVVWPLQASLKGISERLSATNRRAPGRAK
jgi:hypothetical protein